ncbi:MAG TPA: pitrilysin family protein, partial [Chloroflexota bacterium]
MKALSTSLLLLVLVSTTLGGSLVSTDNVVLLPVKNDPTVSFRLWFKVGSQDDPPGKEGLAAITAQMLTDAATTRNSYEQVLDKLFPLAAGYSASVSAEQTVITGRVHTDNMREYYPLFMDAILRPAFRQEDLDRIKSQTLNTLENTLRYSSDEELGKAVLYSAVFAGTGYGHTTEGLIGAVRSITLEDVRDFYRKHFTAGNVIAGIGGGYTSGLVDSVTRDLGTLPAGAPAPVPPPAVKPFEGFHVVLVDKDAPATAISMGFPLDVLRGEKDWYPLALATSWLGEHRNSSSHLYQVIREQRGLNYGDYAYIENFPHAGARTLPPQNAARHRQLFEIWIRPVPNETGHFALRAALREYKKLVENGMTQSEFELTRSFLSKYVLQFGVTTMDRLGYALDDRFYGISGSHLENYRKALKVMTVEDVNAAIKRHWHYGAMEIAIVTKGAQGLKDALLQDRPSPITYKTPKPQGVMEEDKAIEKFPVPVKPENIKVV